MSEAEKPASKSSTAETDRQRRSTREQLELLMATSFCARQHGRRAERAVSVFPALEERRKDASVLRADAGDPACPECDRKLSPMSAALVLVLLPSTATSKLVHAAKSLKCTNPMLWAFVQRAHFPEIARVMKRSGKGTFTAHEYQTMASELLESLRDSA